MEHLILLHGALGSSSQLKSLEESLSGKFNIHNLDLPGHGGTRSDSDFSIEQFAQFVQSYIDSKGIDSSHIFGYSMGGYVAAYLAATNPALVRSVVTLGTKFLWNEEIAVSETAMLDPQKIQSKVPAFADELARRHTPEDWIEVTKQTALLLTRMGIHNPLQMSHFHAIECNCLVLLGDNDKMVSLAETVAVFKQLKSGQLGLLPGTEHRIEKADPELLSFLIERFIRKSVKP